MTLFRRIVVGMCGVVLTGCYVMNPADYTAATPGTDMAFEISDAGRSALGGSMGPEISQIEGRVVESDATSMLVAVTAVQLFRGGEQVWTGEKVRIQKAFVTRYYEKRFSKSRTIVMSALGIGAAGFIATRGLLGEGPPTVDLPPDTSRNSLRARRP